GPAGLWDRLGGEDRGEVAGVGPAFARPARERPRDRSRGRRSQLSEVTALACS
ncbi:hypothetical protein T484DRAFT_1907589, partial [Baffinella frigidus]